MYIEYLGNRIGFWHELPEDPEMELYDFFEANGYNYWTINTISTVLNFAYPLNYDYGDWKYKIVFDQYITTREGMTDTIYVDPYIVAFKREPPTHLNARHSDVYPDRIFILIQSARHPDLQGLR